MIDIQGPMKSIDPVAALQDELRAMNQPPKSPAPQTIPGFRPHPQTPPDAAGRRQALAQQMAEIQAELAAEDAKDAELRQLRARVAELEAEGPQKLEQQRAAMQSTIDNLVASRQLDVREHAAALAAGKAELASLRSQHEELAANTMALAFEYREQAPGIIDRMGGLTGPVLLNSEHSPLLRAVEAAIALLSSRQDLVPLWLRRRAWIYTPKGDWMDPTGEHPSGMIQDTARDVQRRRDLDAWQGIFKR